MDIRQPLSGYELSQNFKLRLILQGFITIDQLLTVDQYPGEINRYL